ncbi:hypothetical protein [Alienimonas chondri]|uniref:Uncharacterized protein n=1 Tax=Alienimonas chondri TaxID=2681879 RepID=A0ABX1VFC2_9PLAN|nr:hypothetical protein [Alienimonas chondri]NNJ26195.1 hypothetical protein [Alienimonas chondri]
MPRPSVADILAAARANRPADHDGAPDKGAKKENLRPAEAPQQATAVRSSPASAAAMLSEVRGGDEAGGGTSPPSVAAMLGSIRRAAVSASPLSTATMLDAVRERGARNSPPSVAEMLVAVRGEAGDHVSPPSVAEMLIAVGHRPRHTSSSSQTDAATPSAKEAARPSVAEILAAARGADGQGGGAKSTPAPSAPAPAQSRSTGRPSAAEIIARARGKAAPTVAKTTDAPKQAAGPPPIPLSVAEMVAALRSQTDEAVPTRAKPPRGGWFARLFETRV